MLKTFVKERVSSAAHRLARVKHKLLHHRKSQSQEAFDLLQAIESERSGKLDDKLTKLEGMVQSLTQQVQDEKARQAAVEHAPAVTKEDRQEIINALRGSSLLNSRYCCLSKVSMAGK